MGYERRTGVLRHRQYRAVQAGRDLCRPHTQGRKAGGFTGPERDQI